MIIFIVNPSSAGGRGKKIWYQLEPVLMEKQISYAVHFTQGPDHANHLVKNVLKERTVQAVVAVGGDGTVHEVGQELIGKGIPLGVVPAGSGNDFARALGISTNIKKALERIISLNPYPMDVGQINQKFFVNGAGIGFDGAVAKRTNTSKGKRWLNQWKLGQFAYTISALRLLSTFRPIDMSLIIDGKDYFFSNVWLVAVTNIPFYGGGMKVCPHAIHDDGILDICIVRNLSRIQFLKCLGKVFRGEHVYESGVMLMRAESITIDSKEILPVHTDGESYPSFPITIQVQKHALNVL